MRLPLALTRNFSLHRYGLTPPQRLQLMRGRGAVAEAIVHWTLKVDMPVGPSRREVRQAGTVRDALFVEHDLFRKPGTTFRNHARTGTAWRRLCCDVSRSARKLRTAAAQQCQTGLEPPPEEHMKMKQAAPMAASAVHSEELARPAVTEAK